MFAPMAQSGAQLSHHVLVWLSDQHPQVISDERPFRSGQGRLTNDRVSAGALEANRRSERGASRPGASGLQSSFGRAARSGYGPRGRTNRRRGLEGVPWPHPSQPHSLRKGTVLPWKGQAERPRRKADAKLRVLPPKDGRAAEEDENRRFFSRRFAAENGGVLLQLMRSALHPAGTHAPCWSRCCIGCAAGCSPAPASHNVSRVSAIAAAPSAGRRRSSRSSAPPSWRRRATRGCRCPVRAEHESPAPWPKLAGAALALGGAAFVYSFAKNASAKGRLTLATRLSQRRYFSREREPLRGERLVTIRSAVCCNDGRSTRPCGSAIDSGVGLYRMSWPAGGRATTSSPRMCSPGAGTMLSTMHRPYGVDSVSLALVAHDRPGSARWRAPSFSVLRPIDFYAMGQAESEARDVLQTWLGEGIFSKRGVRLSACSLAGAT